MKGVDPYFGLSGKIPQYFLFGDYYHGLIAFLVISIIGLWGLLRGVKGENKFFNGLINLPNWLLIMTGILLQIPTIAYVYMGISAGAFEIIF